MSDRTEAAVPSEARGVKLSHTHQGHEVSPRPPHMIIGTARIHHMAVLVVVLSSVDIQLQHEGGMVAAPWAVPADGGCLLVCVKSCEVY